MEGVKPDLEPARDRNDSLLDADAVLGSLYIKTTEEQK